MMLPFGAAGSSSQILSNPQVDLPDVVARLRGEALANFGIGDGEEVLQQDAAKKTYVFPGLRTPGDRSAGAARILRSQAQWLGQGVVTCRQFDDKAVGGDVASYDPAAHLIPRVAEGSGRGRDRQAKARGISM